MALGKGSTCGWREFNLPLCILKEEKLPRRGTESPQLLGQAVREVDEEAGLLFSSDCSGARVLVEAQSSLSVPSNSRPPLKALLRVHYLGRAIRDVCLHKPLGRWALRADPLDIPWETPFPRNGWMLP